MISFFALTISTVFTAEALPVLDQFTYTTTATTSATGLIFGKDVAQTFIVTNTGVLTRVDVLVTRQGALFSGDLLFDIRAVDAAGIPLEDNTHILASAAVNVSGIAGPCSIVSCLITFDGLTAQVTGGQTLAMVFRAASSNTALNLYSGCANATLSDCEPVQITGTKPYPLGSLFFRTPNDPLFSTWRLEHERGTVSVAFQTFVECADPDNCHPAVFRPEIDVHRLTIATVADSFIREGAPNTNEGANPRLRIQDAGNNRVLVAFDLTDLGNALIAQATLVLTIAENGNNWGRANDRTVAAQPLLTGFVEGNGKNAEVRDRDAERGTGPGVTWACPGDANIANRQADCQSRWAGGDFGSSGGLPVTHSNGMTGDVAWDVTADVWAGATGWLIKKTDENLSGRVNYYSREGAEAAGHPEFAPRLRLRVFY